MRNCYRDTATLTVIKSNPISVSSNYFVQAKHVGDNVSFSVSLTGENNFSYQWVHNNVVIRGATNSFYNIDSTVCQDSGVYKCQINNHLPCGIDTFSIVHLLVVDCNRIHHIISGYVTYDNAASTPMTNINVYLRDSGDTIIQSYVTDCTGAYLFTPIPNGTYYITCQTNKKWGGGNPIDALIINRVYINLTSIPDSLWREAGRVMQTENQTLLMLC